ncbi:MAG: hypothetical protein LBN33_02980 [Desulfovibrio sp.]|jgi:Leucine-rich repeat (LRR) protein|nr:hypothetical protein [Desulfovibrio sp.]
MLKRILFTATLVALLAPGLALAAPSVTGGSNGFTIKEGVDDAVLKQIKEGLGQVKPGQLTFRLQKVTDADLEKIVAAYPDLVGLGIESSPAVTKLDPLAKIKKLQTLQLEKINAADLAPLANLTDLLKVKIKNCKSIASLAGLAKATKITDLEIADIAATDATPLAGLTELTRLVIDIRFNDLKWMAKMGELTYITLSGGKNPISLEGLPSLPSMKQIALKRVAPTDLAPLAAALPNLTKIDFNGAVLPDLTPLTQLAKLDDLDLYGATLKDFSPLAGCPSLKKVNYYATKDANYSTLGTLTQVEDLQGGLTKLDDISWIAKLPKLKKLQLFAEYITDYSPLSKSAIEELKIWNMRKPVGDLGFLAGMTSLKKLELTGELNDLTNFNALAGLSNLKLLKITNVNVKSGEPVLLPSLAKLTLLTELDLSRSKVGNLDGVAGAAALEKIDLRNCTDLKSLDPLKKLPKLKRVNVTKDAFTPEQLAGFPESVKVIQ